MHGDVGRSLRQEEHEGTDPDDPERQLVAAGVHVGRIDDQLVECQHDEADLEHHEPSGAKDLLQTILALLVACPLHLLLFFSCWELLAHFIDSVVPVDDLTADPGKFGFGPSLLLFLFLVHDDLELPAQDASEEPGEDDVAHHHRYVLPNNDADSTAPVLLENEDIPLLVIER